MSVLVVFARATRPKALQAKNSTTSKSKRKRFFTINGSKLEPVINLSLQSHSNKPTKNTNTSNSNNSLIEFVNTFIDMYVIQYYYYYYYYIMMLYVNHFL